MGSDLAFSRLAFVAGRSYTRVLPATSLVFHLPFFANFQPFLLPTHVALRMGHH
jgi:hypothetical protein